MTDIVPFEILNNGKFTPSMTGLTIDHTVSMEEWVALGKALAYLHGSIQWMIGDWVNYGEQKFGEKYAQALEQTQYPYGTLTNFAYVARQIEPSRRREELSWSHHYEVAPLQPDQQTEHLEWAVAERASVAELRHKIKGSLPSPRYDDACDTLVEYITYALNQCRDDEPAQNKAIRVLQELHVSELNWALREIVRKSS